MIARNINVMCAFYIPDFQQHLPVLYLKTFAFVSSGLKSWVLVWWSLPSNSHHLSHSDCLRISREIIRTDLFLLAAVNSGSYVWLMIVFVFLPHAVKCRSFCFCTICYFFANEISRELLNRLCQIHTEDVFSRLVPRLDEFKCQGKDQGHQEQKFAKNAVVHCKVMGHLRWSV